MVAAGNSLIYQLKEHVMSDFSRIQLLADSQVIEEHRFPLFEYVGLYQRCYSPEHKMYYSVIVVALEDTVGVSDEKLLNLVAASGYVDDDSDITFRINQASGYFYTYFNFLPDAPKDDDHA